MLDFFDCNVTLGRVKGPAPGGVLDAPKLLSEMDRYGIAEALFYHDVSKRFDPARGNALAVKAASQSPRLHACWMLLPPATEETPPLESLANEMRENNVRAVRIAPDAANHLFSLAPVVCGELFAWLAQRRVPLFMEQAPVPWEHIDAIMEKHPGIHIVLVDIAYRSNRNLYPRMAAYGDLYVETSGLQQHGGFADIHERFGAGRLLFGSRIPFLCPGAARHALENAAIPEEAKTAIAGDNMRRLLAQVEL